MDEQELWDRYRQRQREIRQQIANLQDEEAKLFRSTLQRIQDLNPPQTNKPQYIGALDSQKPAPQERKNDCPLESEDDSEARIARADLHCPNCS